MKTFLFDLYYLFIKSPEILKTQCNIEGFLCDRRVIFRSCERLGFKKSCLIEKLRFHVQGLKLLSQRESHGALLRMQLKKLERLVFDSLIFPCLCSYGSWC